MRRTRIGLVVITLTWVLSACLPAASGDMASSSVPRDTQPDVPPSTIARLAAANNAFGLELYQGLRPQPGNLVFSPFSLSAALAMTYAGARGETESQMARALHFDLPQDGLHPAFNQLDLLLAQMGNSASGESQALQLRIANAIWIDKALAVLESYLDLIARDYGAGIHLADFFNAYEPARREINAWVSSQTEQRIKDLIPEGAVDETTRMVLVNAIYFKGDWQDQFDAGDTRDEPFHLLDGSDVSVRMMHQHFSAVAYAAGSGYQVVELPYTGAGAVMDIIVPDAGEFEQFESALKPATLEGILGSLQPAELELGLPKFNFGTEFDLGAQLSALGMPDAFDPRIADFSGMTGGRDLYISKALHQAFVTVDEKGTEAAAATSIIMAPTSILMPQQRLIVDRPFIFAIREATTGQLLFLGRVLDPTQQ